MAEVCIYSACLDGSTVSRQRTIGEFQEHVLPQLALGSSDIVALQEEFKAHSSGLRSDVGSSLIKEPPDYVSLSKWILQHVTAIRFGQVALDANIYRDAAI